MKLELMFMKHYAPNRCLYRKVAKLRTGVGSAEMSHLQNCSLKIYLKRALGWGGSGWGQDGCERRIKVFVKIQKKDIFLGGFGGGGGGGGGVRVDVNEELKVFVKIQKKIGGGGGGGGCRGSSGKGRRRIKVFVKIQKKKKKN